MDFHKKPRSTLEENERLRLRRIQWLREREIEERHEKRKQYMIAEYEKKRLQHNSKQRSLQQSKSSSPQHRRIISTDDKYSEEFGVSSRFKYEKDTIIDKKELHKIKIDVYKQRTLPMKDQSSSENKMERDIVNLDDIVLPRRKDEGSYPIFKRKEIKAEESAEVRTITLLLDNKSEKQLSTSKKKAYTYRKSPDDNRYSRSDRSMKYQDHRTGDNNRRNSDSPTRSSRDDNKRRCESHSRSAEHAIRDRWNSHRVLQSRSSLTSRQAKEKRISNSESKSLSKRNPERSYESDNRISSQLSMSSGSYDPYARHMYFPRPMPMFRIQAPPIILPIAPGMFSMPFPTIRPHMNRWRPPPPKFPNFVRRTHWNPH